MLKKLIAAMFVATLLAVPAMAEDFVFDATDGRWEDAWNGSGSAATFDSAAITITGTGNNSIGNLGSAAIAGTPTSITMNGAGGTLYIGSNDTYTVAGNAVNLTTGAVTLTVGNVVLHAGSSVAATDLVLSAGGNTFTNAGTFSVGDISVATGKVINSGIFVLTDGSKVANLATALVNGASTDIGTINIDDGIAANAFDISGIATTAGSVNIADQTAAVTGNVKVGGTAALNLNGGDFTGSTIEANKLGFTGGTTKITTSTNTLADGYDIKSGATVQMDGSAATGDADAIRNEGTLEILSSNTLIVGEKYTSTAGVIKNGGTLSIATNNTAAGTAANNKYLTDLVGGNLGDIGIVEFNYVLQGNLGATGILDGDVELKGTQTAAVDVNVGAADLKISGAGTNKFANVTAATINNTQVVEFSGAVTGDVTTGAAVTFKGSSASLTGNLDATAGNAITIDEAAITIANGKTLTNSAGNVTLTGAGASLTLAAGSTYAGGSRIIAAADNTVKIDAGVANFAAAVTATYLTDSTSVLEITNNGTTPVDFTGSGIALGGAIAGSTVKVDMKGKTLGNAGASLTAGAADILVTGDTIFDGAVVGANVTIDGVSGTFTTTITGDVTVTGGTIATGGAGATTITGNLAVDGASTIMINGKSGSLTDAATLTATGTTVSIDTNAKLSVGSTVTSGDIFDAGTISSWKTADGLSDADIQAWLDANKINNMKNIGEFNLSGGKVVYSGAAQTDKTAGMYGALDSYNAGDFRPLVNNNLVNNVSDAIDIFNNEPAFTGVYAAMSDEDKHIIDVLAAIGVEVGTPIGDFRTQGNAGYAANRWATGQDLANSFEAVMDTVRNFTNAVKGRAFTLGQASQAFGSYEAYGAPLTMLDCNNYANRIWAGYTGMWGDADARGGDRGYEYDAHGFNIGYDRAFSNGFSFGAAFGYSKGDFDLKGGLGSDSDIDNYSFALYGSWMHCSGLFTTLVGSYTYSDYNMNNEYTLGNWDRADYHSNTWSVGGEVGYEFRPTQNFSLTPTIGLYYYDTASNRFNTSAGRLGMKYSASSVEMPIELTAKYDICLGAETNLTLVGKGGYTYNFRDKGTKIDRFVMGGTGLVMGGDRGRSAGHSGWNIGGGANMQYRNFDFGVNYEYNARSDYDSHNLWVNAGIRF